MNEVFSMLSGLTIDFFDPSISGSFLLESLKNQPPQKNMGLPPLKVKDGFGMSFSFISTLLNNPYSSLLDLNDTGSSSSSSSSSPPTPNTIQLRKITKEFQKKPNQDAAIMQQIYNEATAPDIAVNHSYLIKFLPDLIKINEQPPLETEVEASENKQLFTVIEYFTALQNEVSLRKKERLDLDPIAPLAKGICDYIGSLQGLFVADFQSAKLPLFEAKKKLLSLAEGHYIVFIPGRTIAWVKDKDGTFLFEPSRGLVHLSSLDSNSVRKVMDCTLCKIPEKNNELWFQVIKLELTHERTASLENQLAILKEKEAAKADIISDISLESSEDIGAPTTDFFASITSETSSEATSTTSTT